MTVGELTLDTWYNARTKTLVEVIGSTPKRLRIRAITRTRIPGDRVLEVGDTVLVPPYAVRNIREESV